MRNEIYTHTLLYNLGRTHKLKREEVKDINQDKKAITAEREYLLQIFPVHNGLLAAIII